MPPLLLLGLGFVVGSMGTLIGAGGGFILMPVLIFFYPTEAPEVLTAISLVIVFINALSGSVAYAYRKRIDYRSALIFSIAAAPGSFLGVYLISQVPRSSFDFSFGLMMILIALYILFRKQQAGASGIAVATEKKSGKYPVRILKDRYGHEHSISYSYTVGTLLSLVVGFVSSILGIGGGIIHVPAMTSLLHFPTHIATATSHCILVVMAFIASVTHFVRGDLTHTWDRIMWLAPGVLVGAQVGAYLSTRLKGSWIIRALALALLSVGVRLVISL